MLPANDLSSSNIKDDTTSMNADIKFQPVVFKPAGGEHYGLASNSADFFDFNELFADEFYPSQIDFSNVVGLTSMDMRERNLLADVPSSELHSIASPIPQHHSDASHSNGNHRNKDDIYAGKTSQPSTSRVVLVPPTVPRYMPAAYLQQIADKMKGPTTGKRGHQETVTDSRKVVLDQSVDTEDRRERNREHAKRSRIRKKLLLDSLQDQLESLRETNNKLRRIIVDHVPAQQASQILTECTNYESNLLSDGESLLASRNNKIKDANNAKVLLEADYRLVQSLIVSQQSYLLTDPALPDNPIVYASEGFCKMTGYKREQVIGRNCRFLQGPGTDQNSVNLIRQGIENGDDVSVCLLNYKSDGKPFWNQFFLAALKDADGKIVNYVGVQCEVNGIPVTQIKDRVKRLPVPDEA